MQQKHEFSIEGASVDVVAWLCIQERKLLMTRTQGKAVFYLPGGKRQLGESDWQALSREVREEVNVTLLPEAFAEIFLIEAPAHGYAAPTQVQMKCFRADYVGKIAPSSEIAEISWFGLADQHRCAPATQQVLEKLSGWGLID